MLNFNIFYSNKIKRRKCMNKITNNIDKYKRCVIEAKSGINLKTLFAFLNTTLHGQFYITRARYITEENILYYHIEIRKEYDKYIINISDRILTFDYDRKDIIVINDLKDIGIPKVVKEDK